MRLRYAGLLVAAALLVVLASSYAVGRFAADESHATIARAVSPNGVPLFRIVHEVPEESFDWEVALIFGTALATTVLAFATGGLAFSTRSVAIATQASVIAESRPVLLVPLQHQPVQIASGEESWARMLVWNAGRGPAFDVRVTLDKDELAPTGLTIAVGERLTFSIDHRSNPQERSYVVTGEIAYTDLSGHGYKTRFSYNDASGLPRHAVEPYPSYSPTPEEREATALSTARTVTAVFDWPNEESGE